MAETLASHARQLAFAAHIRDPQHVPLPGGIDDARMAVYRRLFFNNLRNLLGGQFPVLRKLYDDENWGRLVRGFMRSHRARTPYFLQLPGEFVDFLAGEHEPAAGDVPFLAELAHYEFAELKLATQPDPTVSPAVAAEGDLLAGIPVRNPLSLVYAYQWPVHRINAGYRPGEPCTEPVFLALYRDGKDKVRFLELNAITAALLERINDNTKKLSGAELLRELARETAYPDPARFVAHGAQILLEMRSQSLLIGSRTAEVSS